MKRILSKAGLVKRKGMEREAENLSYWERRDLSKQKPGPDQLKRSRLATGKAVALGTGRMPVCGLQEDNNCRVSVRECDEAGDSGSRSGAAQSADRLTRR